MDFKDIIKQLSERIDKLKDNLPTEEATKNALIMPFLSALGYDVFNPLEVLPEMSCDIGMKKGEKIDYAILKDGEPVMLIECKHWAQDLNLHDNQLLRYFNVSKAKFGILTNGITYRFYTDLEEPNKMDEKPFLEVNLTDIKDAQIEELKKFHKSYFDINDIMSSASELKYMGELKSVISREFSQPSAEFVKFFGKQVYNGFFMPKVAEQFAPLVKRAINSYINDIISDRLKNAMTETENSDIMPQQQPTANEHEEGQGTEDKKQVVTTEEELEGYYIVKSILRNEVAPERIAYRDNLSYFNILLDDTIRKTICRLYLNRPSNKRIAFIEDGKEVLMKIEDINDIYGFADRLMERVKSFENK